MDESIVQFLARLTLPFFVVLITTLRLFRRRPWIRLLIFIAAVFVTLFGVSSLLPDFNRSTGTVDDVTKALLAATLMGGFAAASFFIVSEHRIRAVDKSHGFPVEFVNDRSS